ncbi:hypothetical protein BAUCODRAFT_52771, partial [Baudoinia panamericana UAMH 10762]
MAPGSANKRKRLDRQFTHEDGGRPSPHRPENLSMAQRMEHGGGPRRGGGGGRRQSRQSNPADGVNAVPVVPRNALSPPAPSRTPLQVATPSAEISRNSTPLPPTAVSALPPAEEMPMEPPAPYAYDVITDAMIPVWQENGKQSVLDTLKDADELGLNTVLQELVRSGLDGRLEAVEVGREIQQVISELQSDDLDAQTSFLNTISLLDEADTQNPALLAMLVTTEIDAELVRQNLDVPLLTTLSLVRQSFNQIRARKTTNLLYRQANFNLLREETEGYAKLLTEYFNVAEESNKTTNPAIAEDAFQRIMALVGAFDLDVGRVLDITLDISANLLVKAYPFFIKFYRCSSWWPDGGNLDSVRWEDDGFNTFPAWALPGSGRVGPSDNEKSELVSSIQSRDKRFWEQVREKGIQAFYELGARRIVDFDSVVEQLSIDAQPELDSRGKEITEDRRKRANENRKYMRETGVLPAPGNSDAAQLLGFKLRFYASPARDPDDVMPDNLIHFAALLIKTGFVSLRDLYPHLHPPDEKMEDERARLEEEKTEKEARAKPGGGPNALAMASALTDDTLPVARGLRSEKDRSGGATPKPAQKEDATADPLQSPPNQKIGLLKALLALGAIPEALYILGRFPWLLDVDTTLPPYLHRIVRHMLLKVSDTVRPLATRPGVGEGRQQLNDTAAKSDGPQTFVPRAPKLPTKWLGLEEVSERDGSRYRYYYTQWADNLPLCQTLDDVFLLCDSLVAFLGVKIGQDTAILGTLVRLARNDLAEDGSESNRARWLELMKRLLVPALSLSKHNQSLSDEIYQLLMLYPITARYEIYAEWFTGKTSRLADIKVAFDHNKAEVKDVLRRVSNENVKSQSRALGKVSYSSPGVLIMFMINQLETYSNMIPAMVECTKYFSKLAFDVLIWCLINSLSGQGRDRMQADGMLTSPWLQALSQFVASLFHRYSNINPSPVLQYLASELRAGNSTDLEMFEQVLGEMAGIRADVEFNDNQVYNMAGGENLRAYVMQQLGDTRHARKAQARRLIKALAEPGLIGQTLIAIAQEKQMYPHHEASKFMPLKVLGNNLDKIQQVFTQYLEVLRTNLKPEEFETAVPDVVSLVGDFKLAPGIAFTICRSVIAHRMAAEDSRKLEASRKNRASHGKAQVNGEVEMQDADAQPASGAEQAAEEKPAINGEFHEHAVTEAEAQIAAKPMPNGVHDQQSSPWHPVLQPLIDRLPTVTGNLADRVSIPFFVTFWTLSQSDIFTNFTDVYKFEIKRLDDEIKVISRDRGDRSTAATSERSRKVKALTEVHSHLNAEVKNQLSDYMKLSGRLSRQEKAHWFARSRNRPELEQRHTALLQECFIPRALMSSLDAHYSYMMLRMLHDKSAPGFSTLILIDRLMQKQELAAIISQCTGQEAQHFGRFLNEMLKMLAEWHASRSAYEQHALGNRKVAGFVTGPMDYGASPDTWTFMDYELYRRQLTNWHTALCNALQLCFESREYMHIRNGIHVLKAVVGVFPALTFQGKALIAAAEKISKEDSRQDLKLMALSLLGPLKTREKAWVMPQAFRLAVASKEGESASRAASVKPETPMPEDATPKLNAAAPEFKPSAQALTTNGVVKKESLAGVEDGEVEEEK